jgi:hypothetical protein
MIGETPRTAYLSCNSDPETQPWHRLIAPRLFDAPRKWRNIIVERSHKGLNSRAKKRSPLATKMGASNPGFSIVASLRSFVSIYSAIRNLFVPFHSHGSTARLAEFVAKQVAKMASSGAAVADATQRQ